MSSKQTLASLSGTESVMDRGSVDFGVLTYPVTVEHSDTTLSTLSMLNNYASTQNSLGGDQNPFTFLAELIRSQVTPFPLNQREQEVSLNAIIQVTLNNIKDPERLVTEYQSIIHKYDLDPAFIKYLVAEIPSYQNHPYVAALGVVKDLVNNVEDILCDEFLENTLEMYGLSEGTARDEFIEMASFYQSVLRLVVEGMLAQCLTSQSQELARFRMEAANNNLLLPKEYFKMCVSVCVHWSLDEVLAWVSSLSLSQYKEAFRKNNITGRKLIFITASSLPKMGITDFRHMKLILRSLRDILGVSPDERRGRISGCRKSPMVQYLEYHARTGAATDSLSYYDFLVKNKLLEYHEEPKFGESYEKIVDREKKIKQKATLDYLSTIVDKADSKVRKTVQRKRAVSSIRIAKDLIKKYSVAYDPDRVTSILIDN